MALKIRSGNSTKSLSENSGNFFAMRGHPVPEEEAGETPTTMVSPTDMEGNTPPGRRRDLSQIGGEAPAQLLLEQVGQRKSNTKGGGNETI